MLDFIALPLGQFLNFIYNFIALKNYGLAIILFTLFVKLAILPLAVKQYRSMAKMQEVQPLLAEIQRKYKNDKEKLNQETLKIYQENKVNPAGGCLPLLIQMPIIISLYWVIQKPLSYMLGMSKQMVNDMAIQFGLDPNVAATASNIEIEIISKNPELINLSFLGLNLGHMPQLNSPNVLWLIPILAALSTYFSTKIASPTAPQAGSDENPAMAMQKNMMLIFPFMTGYFTFVVPAGVGLYWIISNLFQILQQIYLNKFVIRKKEVKKS